MAERPLNERPAARPTGKLHETISDPEIMPVQQVAPSRGNNLSCLSVAIYALIGSVVVFLLWAFITSLISAIENKQEVDVVDTSSIDTDPRASYPISDECDRAMAASAADQTEQGELLLVESGNVCSSRKEWEAALYRYPAAIGGTSTAYLDGSEYGILCRTNPEVRICRTP